MVAVKYIYIYIYTVVCSVTSVIAAVGLVDCIEFSSLWQRKLVFSLNRTPTVGPKALALSYLLVSLSVHLVLHDGDAGSESFLTIPLQY